MYSPCRICFVSYSIPRYQPGGAEVQMWLMGKELLKRGWEVHFTCLDHGQRNTEVIEGIVVHKTFNTKSGIRGLRAIRNIQATLSALDCADADIYYQRGAGYLTGLTGHYCSTHHKKFVFTAAHLDNCTLQWVERSHPIKKFFYLYGLKRADKVVVLAEYMRKAMKDNLGIDPLVIHSGYPIPKRVGKKQYPPIVLWVGRLENWKRPELFLELARALPKIHFGMIGGESLSGRAYADGIINAVRRIPNLDYKGYVPFDRINEYFEKASLFVNTSVSEGFPNTFIQAWMQGTPVVSLDVDPDCIICKNKLGFHSKSMGNLIKDTAWLLNSKSERSKMSKNCLSYARKHYDIKKTTHEHIRLYEGLLRR